MKTASPWILCAFLLACSSGSEDARPRRSDPPRPLGAAAAEGFAVAPGAHEEASERDEERLSEERQAWIERMHRSAPDVDWREVERANGERAQARRNAWARGQRAGLLAAGAPAWHEVGSQNLAGRMHVAARSTDGLSVVAGSSLGGVWRSALDGSSWTPLSDNLYGGVYDLALIAGEHAGDPDVLVVRTGSKSVRVSRDDGATWEIPSFPGALTEVRGMAVLSTPVPTVLVCGLVSGQGNQVTLFASTDWGRTFPQRWKSSSNGKGSMWVPRSGAGAASDVYVARQGDLLVSTDGGVTFSPAGTIATGVSDVRLTGSEAGAPSLYAMATVGGAAELYASQDAGLSFQHAHTPASYWGALCASSRDPLVVAYGNVEAFVSKDGGASFAKVNSWTQYYGNPQKFLHADIQGLTVVPDAQNPAAETWYVGCDGGLYASADQLDHVANLSLSGLGVSQYYSTLTSSANALHILAGSQDQGYQYGVWQAPQANGPSTPFNQLISGDYGHLTSSDGSHALVYSTYPGFLLISQGEGANQLFSADFPATNHDWLPMVVADPSDANAAFFCGDRLWRYQRTGNTWTPQLHSAFDFTAGGAAYLSALAFAAPDASRAFAVTNNGRLYHSSDFGLSWTAAASSGPQQHYFYGNAIAVHPENSLEAAVGGSGYSSAGVVRSVDGGATWQAETTGLPATQVYDLVYARDGSGDLYAATEAGPYHWQRSSGVWLDMQLGVAPLTLYWSVEAVGQNRIRFGTYGRGIWDYMIQPDPAWSLYGQGKTTSQGLVPALTGGGTPALSSDDFQIIVSNAVPGALGIVMHSAGPAATPFKGGTLWLAPPVLRGPNFHADAFGLAGVHLATTPALVGTTRYYQVWIRDPAHPDGTGIALSDAMQVTYGL